MGRVKQTARGNGSSFECLETGIQNTHQPDFNKGLVWYWTGSIRDQLYAFEVLKSTPTDYLQLLRGITMNSSCIRGVTTKFTNNTGSPYSASQISRLATAFRANTLVQDIHINWNPSKVDLASFRCLVEAIAALPSLRTLVLDLEGSNTPE